MVETERVFSRKLDSVGNVIRHRARLVARGYCQTEGIDYNEDFAPVARYQTLRFLLALKVIIDYDVLQIDVKNAVLLGKISDEIYVKVPQGIQLSKLSDDCFQLYKALYGLKQATRVRNEQLCYCLTTIGFKTSIADSFLYLQVKRGKKVFLLMYVDVLPLIGKNRSCINNMSIQIAEKFVVPMDRNVDKGLGIDRKIKK